MTIYKQYGIYLTLENQKTFFDYMSLGGNRTTFNLKMLAKLFYVICNIAFKSQVESQKEHLEPKQSAMDRFTSNLQSKLAIAFSSSSDLLRFLDLNESENLKIEEFAFGV
jgi:hypothetical protein